MKKILYIVSNLHSISGVNKSIINFYNFIDHKKFQIDFYVVDQNENRLEENFEYSNIYYSKVNNVYLSYYKEYKNFLLFLEKYRYDIIELHAPVYSFIYLKAASKKNIQVRIVHAHSSIKSTNKLKNLIHTILNINMKKYSNALFACSLKSGKYWYGRKHINSFSNYYTIYNGIDREKFSSTSEKNLYKKFNLDRNKKIIGFVGRMSSDKNLKFLIKVFKKMPNNFFESYQIIFVGDGKKKNELKEYSRKQGNYVQFVGAINNIDRYINDFSLILLSSKREGLPMTAIEAQMSNVPCILCDKITTEVDIGLALFLPLNKKTWLENIKNTILTDKETTEIDYDKFDIKVICKKLEKIYIELLENRKNDNVIL